MEHAAQRSATVPAALWAVSGITDGALLPGHAHGEVLHPGCCTITSWCLRFHCAIRKFRLWALTKLLLLSAICTVVFAHWLYCQRRSLVLCKSKKTPCCGFQVCWKSLADSVLPINIAQSTARIPRLRQESQSSLSRSPTPACRGDSAVLSASTQLTVHPLQVGLFPSRNALSAHFSHIFQASVILTQQSAKTCRKSFEMRCNSFCVFSLVFKTCSPHLFFFFFSGAAFLIPKKTGDPDRDVIWWHPEAVNSG